MDAKKKENGVPIPSTHFEINNNDTLVHGEVHPTGIDSRKEILVAVVLHIFGIVTTGLVLVCRRKKLLCFAPRGNRVIFPNTVPVQESVGQGDQVVNVGVPVPGQLGEEISGKLSLIYTAIKDFANAVRESNNILHKVNAINDISKVNKDIDERLLKLLFRLNIENVDTQMQENDTFVEV